MYNKNDNQDNHSGRYPIELPSRSNSTTTSPIVDVVEAETFPLEFANCHRTNPRFGSDDDTEIITTEKEPDTEEQTIHGR